LLASAKFDDTKEGIVFSIVGYNPKLKKTPDRLDSIRKAGKIAISSFVRCLVKYARDRIANAFTTTFAEKICKMLFNGFLIIFFTILINIIFLIKIFGLWVIYIIF